MALETELETYRREAVNLAGREGKFVVIRGSEVEGIFDTYEDALRWAYDKWGATAFLVKKIQHADQALFFTRELEFLCLT